MGVSLSPSKGTDKLCAFIHIIYAIKGLIVEPAVARLHLWLLRQGLYDGRDGTDGQNIAFKYPDNKPHCDSLFVIAVIKTCRYKMTFIWSINHFHQIESLNYVKIIFFLD